MVCRYLLFDSITSALRAEKALKARNIPLRLVPVPRELSADCGICLRISSSDAPAAVRVLQEERIEMQGCKSPGITED